MQIHTMPHQTLAPGTRAVALCEVGRYSPNLAANSANGLGRSASKKRISAPITIAGAFFTSANSFYGGCAWEALGPAGFLLPRSTNPRTAATLIRLVAKGGSSHSKRSFTYARPQSVQNSRRCTPCNGSRRFTHQFKPLYPHCPLQPSHVQSPHPCCKRGCAMSPSPLMPTVGGATFGKCNVQDQRLFSVNAGVSSL